MSKHDPEFQIPLVGEQAPLPERVAEDSRSSAAEAPLPDVCLMLRTHAEMRCLSREVIPVLRQVETRDDLPEDQVGAALAYLEVTWIEARRRAGETDAAYAELTQTLGLEECEGDPVYGNACRYRAAVLVLRDVVTRRVGALLASPEVGLTQSGGGC